MILFARRAEGVFALIGRACQQGRQLRQGIVIFQSLKVIKDGLLDQPVGVRSIFDAAD